MTKYSHEFRLSSVRKVLDGNSISGTAKELAIPKTVLQTWVNHYYEGGTEQLLHKMNIPVRRSRLSGHKETA